MPRQRLARTKISWTPDLAYAVGLLTTDGYISKDKRHIVLVSTDTQLLETFRLCLNKNNAISHNPPGGFSGKPAYRIQIGDVVLYDQLISIGLYPNKSLTIGKLDIPDKFLVDFLRGHIDGDGSIIYYKDKYNTHLNPKYIYDRLFVIFRSASKKHIEWIRETIIRIINIHGALIVEPPRNNVGKTTMTLLKFSTKEAKILLNHIYYKPKLPCLLRKFKIAAPFLNHTN